MSGRVIVKLNGGLGNQLWGWAAGFSLARRLNCGLSLDCRDLHQRKFQLDEINTDASVRRSGKFNYWIGAQTLSKLIDPLRARPDLPEFREQSFFFDPRFRDLAQPVELRGYFQSPKYFEANQELVREKILVVEKLNRAKQLLRELAIPENFIAVHIRLGDYTSSREVFPELGPAYYRAAVSRVKQLHPDFQVVCFTDSLVGSQKIFPTADFYVGPEAIPIPLDNLLAMSRSAAFVGSNSSFSWWAAYLLEDPAAVRFFPKRWFTDPEIDTSDLFLPGWQAL